MGGSGEDSFSFKELLQLLGPHPYSMKIKGGAVPCCVQYVIMTSNKHPKDWYSSNAYASEKNNQLIWRINDGIFEVKKKNSIAEKCWDDREAIETDFE
jgi:hypothetical protein